ncbi:MAG: cysteine--tRNA ligase [Planctomycetota bacterium]|jgi:cysteinyl-tRNA synthetase
MSIRLYNTLTRSKDQFVPIESGKIGLYTCGLTVYNYAHIGNLRTYVFEDVLKRALRMVGYEVNHVMNVTDVGHLVSDADEGEDKMAVGARREGKTAWEIADFYWAAFREDLKRLHIIEPDIWCKATDNIPEQIDLVRRLEEKGFTYAIEGDGIYFDTSKLADYGKLARLDVEGLQAGARIEMVAGKRNATDFALWKFSPTDQQRQMEWDSPWGVGFPGWHIECSAMAIKFLGEYLDIHCGGVDHVPVHHTNEIAQAESAMGHKWVNWWMHGEWLVLPKEGADAEGGEKMSKSTGEFLTLQSLIDRGYDPLAYRYFLLNAHYRQQLAFTWEALDSAASAFGRLKREVLDLREHYTGGEKPIEERMSEFRQAVTDDLNAPRALAAMWGTIRDSQAPKGEIYATLLAMDDVLGFAFTEMEEVGKNRSLNVLPTAAVSEYSKKEVETEISRLKELKAKLRRVTRDADVESLCTEMDETREHLIAIRMSARSRKDFELADYIRDSLEETDERLVDLSDGSTTSDYIIFPPTISESEKEQE